MRTRRWCEWVMPCPTCGVPYERLCLTRAGVEARRPHRERERVAERWRALNHKRYLWRLAVAALAEVGDDMPDAVVTACVQLWDTVTDALPQKAVLIFRQACSTIQ